MPLNPKGFQHCIGLGNMLQIMSHCIFFLVHIHQCCMTVLTYRFLYGAVLVIGCQKGLA